MSECPFWSNDLYSFMCNDECPFLSEVSQGNECPFKSLYRDEVYDSKLACHNKYNSI